MPKNAAQRVIRIMYILICFLRYSFLRVSLKEKVISSYREFLSNQLGILPVDINSLINWNKLSLKLFSPTSNAGQLTHLELLAIIGITKSFLKPGENFLEIGTFDGNTALNIAKNIPEYSKLITIDLPENSSIKAKFDYDNFLIKNENRSKKRHLNLKNVNQIYHDSTTYDFSKLTFNAAFIDGGHDYETVKTDTLNVLKYIKRPGIIFWHDYDVECEIGNLLHELVKEHSIKWIKETRLTFLEIN